MYGLPSLRDRNDLKQICNFIQSYKLIEKKKFKSEIQAISLKEMSTAIQSNILLLENITIWEIRILIATQNKIDHGRSFVNKR